MRVLELGSYVLPAYAGMVLAEQGAKVVKWTHPDGALDPVQQLRCGDQLWEWLNEGKTLTARHNRDVATLRPGTFDAVIDNVRAGAWTRWGIDVAALADRLALPWVSMRDEFDDRSFDAIAQARSLMEHMPYAPVYLGDTSGGLWLAFKLLACVNAKMTGHHVLRQASCLAKLVEGELRVPGDRSSGAPAWDPPGHYGADPHAGGVKVLYRGETVREPVRDHTWKWKHLHHDGSGRITI
jgi:hypothetical protein